MDLKMKRDNNISILLSFYSLHRKKAESIITATIQSYSINSLRFQC